jgi:hypothetical protein
MPGKERRWEPVIASLPSRNSAFGWEKSLWSVGAGFRWVVAPKNDISLRVDVARGRDETIYYVGVGEAF